MLTAWTRDALRWTVDHRRRAPAYILRARIVLPGERLPMLERTLADEAWLL